MWALVALFHDTKLTQYIIKLLNKAHFFYQSAPKPSSFRGITLVPLAWFDHPLILPWKTRSRYPTTCLNARQAGC